MKFKGIIYNTPPIYKFGFYYDYNCDDNTYYSEDWISDCYKLYNIKNNLNRIFDNKMNYLQFDINIIFKSKKRKLQYQLKEFNKKEKII